MSKYSKFPTSPTDSTTTSSSSSASGPIVTSTNTSTTTTSTTSWTLRPAVRVQQKGKEIILTENAATPASQANEVFVHASKDYKKASVKLILKRYGKSSS